MSLLDEVRAQRDAMTNACANMLVLLDRLVVHSSVHLNEPTEEREQALRAALQAVRTILPTVREAVLEAAKIGEKEASRGPAYTPSEFFTLVTDAGRRINDALRDDSVLISLCAAHMIRDALLGTLSDQTEPRNALTLENYKRFVEHSRVRNN